MPTASLRVCAFPSCRARQDATRCPKHERMSSRNHGGVPRQARGLGAEFDALKPVVIARDGGRCQLRLPGCTAVATTADHIVPRSRGGLTTVGNLRAACGHCNSSRRAG